MRLYRSGSRWAFWRWTDTGEGITRLHIVKSPIGAIIVHFINEPDPEPWSHDHPTNFVSFILRGWYIERRCDYGRQRYAKRVWFNRLRASRDCQHSVLVVSPGGCVTLCFMGPVRRLWGYHTSDGWIDNQTYFAKKRVA